MPSRVGKNECAGRFMAPLMAPFCDLANAQRSSNILTCKIQRTSKSVLLRSTTTKSLAVRLPDIFSFNSWIEMCSFASTAAAAKLACHGRSLVIVSCARCKERVSKQGTLRAATSSIRRGQGVQRSLSGCVLPITLESFRRTVRCSLSRN